MTGDKIIEMWKKNHNDSEDFPDWLLKMIDEANKRDNH
jgi:hypothetical protein